MRLVNEMMHTDTDNRTTIGKYLGKITIDAPPYVTRDPTKVLASHGQQKKKKYLDECLQQRRSFSPFVISTDDLLGFEAKSLVKQLARHLVKR